MKRLFGLIGITYLATLTAVFYFKSPVFITLVLIISAFVIILGIVFKIKKNDYMFKTLLIAGITIIAGVAAIFLYQNIHVNPIINNYSDKEISVEGYVCEEIRINGNKVEYLIQTERINSDSVRTKIKYTGYSETGIKEFDRVELNIKAFAESGNQNIGHGILLRGYERTPSNIKSTGESKFSLYKYAIMARKDIRKAINRLMPSESASLCKAILLGDKDALSKDLKTSFAKTGTSYLIVVSGLHLSIALTLVTSFLRRFTKRRLILGIGAIISVICFAALTGFNFSVIRAAITVIIYELGRIVIRKSDPLNSLGIAALAMTVTNPFAIGDLGMLMSFSATMGIILWRKNIFNYIFKTARVYKITNYRIKTAFCSIIELFSVSVSASLWIVPITVIAFGTISPLVVIIALITEPIASAILVLALLSSLLYLYPVAPIITRLLGFCADMLSRLLIQINSFFARLSITSIKAEGFAIYAWIALIIILTAIGYIIKAKRTYVISAINISVATLMIITAVSFLTADKRSKLTVYQSGDGVSIEIRKENNISLPALGGNTKYANVISDEIIGANCEIDNIIIPDENYSFLFTDIIEDYKVSNIITDTDLAEDIEYISAQEPYVLQDNTIQTVKLNSTDTITIINSDVMYQLISSDEYCVLFIPRGGDVNELPEEYRAADYAILDGAPKNLNLLDCDNYIYTAKKNYDNKSRVEELFENENITVLNNSFLELSVTK